MPLRVVRPNTYFDRPSGTRCEFAISGDGYDRKTYTDVFSFRFPHRVVGFRKPFNWKIRRDVRTTPNAKEKYNEYGEYTNDYEKVYGWKRPS